MKVLWLEPDLPVRDDPADEEHTDGEDFLLLDLLPATEPPMTSDSPAHSVVVGKIRQAYTCCVVERSVHEGWKSST